MPTKPPFNLQNGYTCLAEILVKFQPDFDNVLFENLPFFA
jgi:hypothetical protein